VYPKTRVWGSKPENVHSSSASGPLKIELRWGCEESSEKTAVGSGVTFKYDPFGRRIEKVSPTATSIFAYDGPNLIETVNSTGGLVAHYAQTMNIDEPLAMQRSGTTYYYEADGLGSITSLSSSAGALANTYTYDSFGNVTNSTGSVTNFLEYTGREFDTESGLFYYRARYFDPTSGRFFSEDPARFIAGPNFYAYVGNRPTVFRDATGRMAYGWGVGGAAGISGGWPFGAAGAEGSFLYVQDDQGNSGVLDCRGGGLGTGSFGASATVQGITAFCPDCQSICDMQGTFGGVEAYAGAGASGSRGGSASVSSTSITLFAQYGVGGGGGGAVLGIVGDCTLIWKKHNCKSAPCRTH